MSGVSMTSLNLRELTSTASRVSLDSRSPLRRWDMNGAPTYCSEILSPEMDPIDHIVTILKSFDIEPRPLDRLVDAYLRKHSELSSTGRRIVAECVFGVARWKRRLDGWLELRGVTKPTNRLRALCYLAWRCPEEAVRLPLDEVTSKACISGSVNEEMPRSFPGGEAAFYSFPDFLYEKLKRSYGVVGARAVALRLNEPSLPVLRVNLLKADLKKARRALAAEGIEAHPTPRSPVGLILRRKVPIAVTQAYKQGLIEIQGEASQLSCILADPKPGERVLDACAGAGGKSLMMAMLMQNQGRIIATDPVSSKLKILRRRALRAGISIIEAMGTKELAKRAELKGCFDLVFIDAPCSGTGTLQRNPDLKWRLDQATIGERVNSQRELLSGLAGWIRPGGRLVYATCSILPEENEEILSEFLTRDGFEVVDAAGIFTRNHISCDGIVTEKGFMKTDPRLDQMDGFFAAVLKRLT